MAINVRRTVVLALVLAGGTTLAEAQATRTWVSGVGDDANPCSRTAPCKTFAGAISKTAAGGEINVLDPGGFGGVTITKSISIVAEASRPACWCRGTNAIIVNAGATDTVVLRGLDIDGLGTGLNGIRFLAGGRPSTSRTARSTGSPVGASPSNERRDRDPGLREEHDHPQLSARRGGIFLRGRASGRCGHARARAHGVEPVWRARRGRTRGRRCATARPRATARTATSRSAPPLR